MTLNGILDCDDETNIWSIKMMTHKDCEEWAAMIAQMQDDPSWHPKWNPKGVKQVKAKRGPNDLEEIIERLEFRLSLIHISEPTRPY